MLDLVAFMLTASTLTRQRRIFTETIEERQDVSDSFANSFGFDSVFQVVGNLSLATTFSLTNRAFH